MLEPIVIDYLQRALAGEEVPHAQLLNKVTDRKSVLQRRLKFVDKIVRQAERARSAEQVSQVELATGPRSRSRRKAPSTPPIGRTATASEKSGRARFADRVMVNQRKRSHIGRFTLLEKIGEGGFGRVYRALDPRLDRQVAIKIPIPGRRPIGEAQVQFEREARCASAIHHPGIVTVYELGEETGLPYIVSALVNGRSLSRWLAEESISLEKSAEIVIQSADALDAVHQQGFVHRDIKPGNLLIGCDGQVRVTDFGLALDRRGRSPINADWLFGTPAFIAPEKLTQQSALVDGRADIFGLGVVLYRLLTGVFPFRGNNSFALQQVLNFRPASPIELNPNVPDALNSICLKAIEKNRRRRLQSAREFADMVRTWLRQTTGQNSVSLATLPVVPQ